MPEGITTEEHNVVNLLAEAWNRFIDLPVQHGDDVHEFRRIIHADQEKVLARPALRALNAKA